MNFKIVIIYLVFNSFPIFCQEGDSSILNCADTVEFFKAFFQEKGEFEKTSEYLSRKTTELNFPVEKCFCTNLTSYVYDADNEEYKISSSNISNTFYTKIYLENIAVSDEWGNKRFINDSGIASCVLRANRVLNDFINAEQKPLIPKNNFNTYAFASVPIEKAKDLKEELSMEICAEITDLNDRGEDGIYYPPSPEIIDYIIGAEIKSITFYNRRTKEIYSVYKPE